MTLVEQLVQHVHVCPVCSTNNEPNTKFDNLVLCTDGQKLRQSCLDEGFWKIVRGLVWIGGLMIVGSVLVGHKLGAEVGIGAFLLVWSLRFEVNS